jgi:hypothetical protein
LTLGDFQPIAVTHRRAAGYAMVEQVVHLEVGEPKTRIYARATVALDSFREYGDTRKSGRTHIFTERVEFCMDETAKVGSMRVIQLAA